MKKFLMALIFGFVLGATVYYLAAQTPDPHKGQPKECHNYPKGKKHPNCYCRLHCDSDGKPTGQEDTKCSTYCRKKDCHCERSCDS